MPVYLNPSTGKVLVPWEQLDERQTRRMQKRLGMQVKDPTASISLDAGGSSRKSKDRLTWWQRWAVDDICSELNTEELLEGHILQRIFITDGRT